VAFRISAARVAAIAVALCAACALAAPAAPALDPTVAARVLALDPERISDADVRDVLAHAPAPRVILISGLALVSMEPFGEFLIAMGYPEDRIRNPRDGLLAYSSNATSSAALAGMLAWHYEHDAMMPLVIGHSQGGMIAIRTLHELAGAFASSIAVVDPKTGEVEPRTTIVDPATAVARPVLGLKVPYASAIATGKLMRLLLGQWAMLGRLRQIPDTAVEFTGFSIAFDPLAFEFGGSDPYVAAGTAIVRNMLLPAGTSHLGVPQTKHLAANPATRAWINAYSPNAKAAPLPADADTMNIEHAADVWWSVKKQWCLAAQALARRAATAATVLPTAAVPAAAAPAAAASVAQ
jgi:hypothetical protein